MNEAQMGLITHLTWQPWDLIWGCLTLKLMCQWQDCMAKDQSKDQGTALDLEKTQASPRTGVVEGCGQLLGVRVKLSD